MYIAYYIHLYTIRTTYTLHTPRRRSEYHGSSGLASLEKYYIYLKWSLFDVAHNESLPLEPFSIARAFTANCRSATIHTLSRFCNSELGLGYIFCWFIICARSCRETYDIDTSPLLALWSHGTECLILRKNPIILSFVTIDAISYSSSSRLIAPASASASQSAQER